MVKITQSMFGYDLLGNHGELYGFFHYNNIFATSHCKLIYLDDFRGLFNNTIEKIDICVILLSGVLL
jgi:hypothetical protein